MPGAVVGVLLVLCTILAVINLAPEVRKSWQARKAR